MEKCKPLEENKIITDAPPGCNWAADNVVAKKKDDDGTYTSGASRFCHNYKPINENQELEISGGCCHSPPSAYTAFRAGWAELAELKA
jgi:hypothetical protein